MGAESRGAQTGGRRVHNTKALNQKPRRGTGVDSARYFLLWR